MITLSRCFTEPAESVCGLDQFTALGVRKQFRSEGYAVDMKPTLGKSDCFDVLAYRVPDLRIINPAFPDSGRLEVVQ